MESVNPGTLQSYGKNINLKRFHQNRHIELIRRIRRAGIAVLGAGLGIGRIGGTAMEAIARQPEAAGDIRSNMIVAAALIEGAAFFAIVVCLLILFMA